MYVNVMYENNIPYTELWMFFWKYFDLSSITIEFQIWWPEPLKVVCGEAGELLADLHFPTP